ncbi:MAG: hypothetical protein ACREF8_06775 [Chthoniobacterales bacterium]
MDTASRINAIRSRAALHNLTLFKLCERLNEQVALPKEKVDYRLIRNWELGKHSAIARNERRACEALEAECDRLDREAFAALAPKFLPPLLAGKLNRDKIDDLLAALGSAASLGAGEGTRDGAGDGIGLAPTSPAPVLSERGA